MQKNIIITTDNRSLTRSFQTKTVHPSLWNFIDQVLAFNIVVGHIPGKANSAADFLPRMETDPSQKKELKLSDNIPTKEIEVSMKANTPDVSMQKLFPDEQSSQLPTLSSNLVEPLKQSGHLDQFLPEILKIQTTDCDAITVHLYKLTNNGMISSVKMQNPFDAALDIFATSPLGLKREHQSDDTLKIVLHWLQGTPGVLKFATFEVKKYAKQLPRLKLRMT